MLPYVKGTRHHWGDCVLISGVLDYTKWVFRAATCPFYQGVLKIRNKKFHCGGGYSTERNGWNGMEWSGMVGLKASTQYMVYGLNSSSSLVLQVCSTFKTHCSTPFHSVSWNSHHLPLHVSTGYIEYFALCQFACTVCRFTCRLSKWPSEVCSPWVPTWCAHRGWEACTMDSLLLSLDRCDFGTLMLP